MSATSPNLYFWATVYDTEISLSTVWFNNFFHLPGVFWTIYPNRLLPLARYLHTQRRTPKIKKEDKALQRKTKTLNSPFGVCSSSSSLIKQNLQTASYKIRQYRVNREKINCYSVASLWCFIFFRRCEFTIKSVHTIEMILCHCNQQRGQVSDWEKSRTFFHIKPMPAGRRTRLQKRGHVLLLPDVW